MVAVPGFAYFPVEFDKRGRTAKDAQVGALEQALAADGFTDLIVVSHGWNNDMQEADALYGELLGNARALIDANKFPSLKDRKFAVFGVLWPSKKFADKDLIPSGAAGVVNTAAVEAVEAQIDELRGGFDAKDEDAKLDKLKELLPKLEDSDAARRRFVEVSRSLVETRSKDDEAQSSSFFDGDSLEVFKQLEQPISFVASSPAPADAAGGAAGLEGEGAAAGLFGDFFSGVISGARNVLNFTTYYQMKERAGLIGSRGVNPILQRIRKNHPTLRMHLIGHSFGGRLVTAAVAGDTDANVLNVASMSLLQAAFSHHALSGDWDGKGSRGFFHRVIEKKAVSGPIAITHTENDKAVGVAYPIASLLAGQDAAGIGDKDSPYGGMGRNGAQKSAAEELKMIKDNPSYTFSKGKIHNLVADACIKDHSDVRNPAVAATVLFAMSSA